MITFVKLSLSIPKQNLIKLEFRMNKVASSFQSLQIPDMFEMPFPFIFSDSRQSVPSHPQWDEIFSEEHYYIKSDVWMKHSHQTTE